jgi:uncharacterized membrane protein YedE/YeeE
MRHSRIAWFAKAGIVLGVAALEWTIAANLLPSQAAAAERSNVVPWLIAWSLVSTVLVAALVITVVLVWIGVTGGRAHAPVAQAPTPVR